MEDPREFLRQKLGEAGLAKFEEGMRLAAEGKGEEAAEAEVEGQSPSCYAPCTSYCGGNSFVSAGAYSRFSF